MKNEWRDNVWLVIELTVVCLAIWFIGVILYFHTAGLFQPRGFDPRDVYMLQATNLKDSNPNYKATGNDSTREGRAEAAYEDFRALIGRIRSNPNVESVAVTSGAAPYNYNFNGRQVNVIDSNDSVFFYGNGRYGTADIVDVLRLKSLTGKTGEQLKAMLRRGEILLSNSKEYEIDGRKASDLIGKEVILSRDSSRHYKVGDIIQSVRRNDYELSYGGTVIEPFDENGPLWGALMLRVKPGRGEAFSEDFRSNPELRSQRNVYLYDLKSLMDKREANQRSTDVAVRMYVVLMLFLLFTIFLGLLGTFWFRIQQRVSETAIRKVCGAKRGDIYRRILGEGVTLLCAAAAAASLCTWPFYTRLRDLIQLDWQTMLASEVIAIILILIGIVLSVWYPACRAMNLDPALAVKED